MDLKSIKKESKRAADTHSWQVKKKKETNCSNIDENSLNYIHQKLRANDKKRRTYNTYLQPKVIIKIERKAGRGVPLFFTNWRAHLNNIHPEENSSRRSLSLEDNFRRSQEIII